MAEPPPAAANCLARPTPKPKLGHRFAMGNPNLDVTRCRRNQLHPFERDLSNANRLTVAAVTDTLEEFIPFVSVISIK
jgi:hypothetical protein